MSSGAAALSKELDAAVRKRFKGQVTIRQGLSFILVFDWTIKIFSRIFRLRIVRDNLRRYRRDPNDQAGLSWGNLQGRLHESGWRERKIARTKSAWRALFQRSPNHERLRQRPQSNKRGVRQGRLAAFGWHRVLRRWQTILHRRSSEGADQVQSISSSTGRFVAVKKFQFWWFNKVLSEIEGLLLSNPKIKDCGVIGIPDEASGELPYAFVVKQPGVTLTEQEVEDFIKVNASNAKWLRGGVKFIEAIPKNPSGKILRRKLRQMYKNLKSKL